jgi:hypothetical protein
LTKEKFADASGSLILRNHLGDRLQKLKSPFAKAFRRLKINAYRKLFVNLRNVGKDNLFYHQKMYRTARSLCLSAFIGTVFLQLFFKLDLKACKELTIQALS